MPSVSMLCSLLRASKEFGGMDCVSLHCPRDSRGRFIFIPASPTPSRGDRVLLSFIGVLRNTNSRVSRAPGASG